tara:strand:+ start:33342 stop:33575 length:234 start_codon:yes stop_codon:yes gene_type:complete
MNIPGYDNWKLASPPEDSTVSPCCGSEYEETVSEAYCCYKCYACQDVFDEPIEQYEYEQNQRESWADMRMDEERLGL